MSMSLDIQRTPELIAVEINSIKNQTRLQVLCNSIEIGRRLIEAKEMIEHGLWGKWLDTCVDYSQSTAQNLMRIAEEYGDKQWSLFGADAKTQAFGKLSYSQAVALLALPADEREAFVENNDVENMSTRELQKVIKERDEAQEWVVKKSEEVRKINGEKQKAEGDLRVTDQVLRETQATVKRLQEDLKIQKKQYQVDIESLQHKISELKAEPQETQTPENEAEIEKLQGQVEKFEDQVDDLQKKIKDLEDQLAAPIETAVVEKIPEDVQKELDRLRSTAQNPAIVKFSAQFEMLVKQFNDILGSLATIKSTDQEAGEKYSKAMSDLIGKMGERL